MENFPRQCSRVKSFLTFYWLHYIDGWTFRMFPILNVNLWTLYWEHQCSLSCRIQEKPNYQQEWRNQGKLWSRNPLAFLPELCDKCVSQFRFPESIRLFLLEAVATLSHVVWTESHRLKKIWLLRTNTWGRMQSPSLIWFCLSSLSTALPSPLTELWQSRSL